MMDRKDIEAMLEIARSAGRAILDVYESDDFGVEHKDDDSPLTRADKASHEVIAAGLAKLWPEIPVISEEGKSISFEERADWDPFFLVDPLDGTKEFIKRNGEFTVNIGLIHRGKAVAGVVYAPVLQEAWLGCDEVAEKLLSDGTVVKLGGTNNTANDAIVAVQSRSHSGEKEQEFWSQYTVAESVSRGSSLKFCMVAEGAADVYFRSGPTWEWDTAAGHAVVNAAGGSVMVHGVDLQYNKETLLNSDGFTVYANKELIL